MSNDHICQQFALGELEKKWAHKRIEIEKFLVEEENIQNNEIINMKTKNNRNKL